MSADTGDGFGPFCGAIGCTEDADVVIDHPKHGERTVCWDYIGDYEVIRQSQQGENPERD
ncbi:hypothetical protein [Halosolutus gelatinilyticus]|uniref:hypothetical protein n=1 Tax=Halosolutus gelatinilyticus TaxID=2931975 RepID=UPI001FF2E2CE|nr:hypothetical protein [Halosolutus gelatinilyticus]